MKATTQIVKKTPNRPFKMRDQSEILCKYILSLILNTFSKRLIIDTNVLLSINVLLPVPPDPGVGEGEGGDGTEGVVVQGASVVVDALSLQSQVGH
jgi:hypothetical protein